MQVVVVFFLRTNQESLENNVKLGRRANPGKPGRLVKIGGDLGRSKSLVKGVDGGDNHHQGPDEQLPRGA
jgi:hypothetical protein